MVRAANTIGVMQGRLLPKYQGRYQSHPVGYWQEEFPKAAKLGLDCIEFILDFNDAEANPLLRPGGVDEILRVAEQTGVTVRTVCADYFIEAPLHHPDKEIANRSIDVLHRLLHNGKALQLTDIVVPCVDHSSMRDAEAENRFVRQMLGLIDTAEICGINLSLETDLPPQAFAALLERFGSARVTVNYDSGNSAALGFDPVEEFACYGARVSDIHIKDRILGGGSVVLGTGSAQFEKFMNALAPLDYRGPFIMQAFRDDEGIDVFRRQLEWIRPRLSPWLERPDA